MNDLLFLSNERIMSLQPLRFNNAKEIDNFFVRLQQLGLIDIEKDNVWQQITSSSPEDLARQFLLASDNNIYLLHDIQEYLKTTSDEAIQASQITFFTAKHQAITLAQIKADPSICEQLTEPYAETVSRLPALNLNLYASDFLFSLNTLEEIKHTKKRYARLKFYGADDDSLLASVSPRSMAASSAIWGHPEPIPELLLSPKINNARKDLLKISLLQQIKLKTHLLKENTKFGNSPEREQLNQWIKEIDDNIANTKKIFQRYIILLNEYHEDAETARLKYQALISDNPDLEAIKRKAEDANKESKRTRKQLERTLQAFRILMPITVVTAYTLLTCLFMLAIVATFLAIGLLFPPAYIVPVILATGGIFAAAAIAASLTLIVSDNFEKLTKGIARVREAIEEKFNNSLADKNEQYQKIYKTALTLNDNFKLISEFPRADAELPARDKLREDLESDLQEIAAFEAKVEKPLDDPKDSELLEKISKSSVGHTGMFGAKRLSLPLPATDTQVDEQPRGRSTSFNY